MDTSTTQVRQVDPAITARHAALAWPLYVTFDELKQRLTGGAR